ncbi:MAG: PKD domain-containing protein [bacterium]
MKKILFISVLFCMIIDVLIPLRISAGPYAPAAGEEGSGAVSYNDSSLIAWASGWEEYAPGPEVASQWQDPTRALGGKAANDVYDIVSLGRGGSITVTFDVPIANGEGWDFAVFENGFNEFLELAYVEVSSDGVLFFRFGNDSRTAKPVKGFGSVDATNIYGLAGKYTQGYGTPFDLAELEDIPELDIGRITHIRIIDIVGDGTCFDSDGDVIYDPYPTVDSAGFDLNAVGVRYQYTQDAPNHPLEISLHGEPSSGQAPLTVTFTLESTIESERIISYEWNFGDGTLSVSGPPLTHTFTSDGEFTVQLDIVGEAGVTAHEQISIVVLAEEEKEQGEIIAMEPSDGATDISLTPVLALTWDPTFSSQHLIKMVEWQIVRKNDNVCVFYRRDMTNFHSLEVPRNILKEDMSYMWRIRYVDTMTGAFSWSDQHCFHTGLFGRDLNGNGIEDDDEVAETVDIDHDGIQDTTQENIKVIQNIHDGQQTLIGLSYAGSSNVQTIEYIEAIDPVLVTDMKNQPDTIHCGIVSFRIKLIDHATSALVSLHFSETIPNGAQWYQFTATAGRNKKADRALISCEGNSALLQLEDGGKEDMDGAKNGLIICTGALGSSNSDLYYEQGEEYYGAGNTIIGQGIDSDIENDIGCFLRSLK